MKSSTVFLAAALSIPAMSAAAQTPSHGPWLVSKLATGQTLERYLQNVRAEFRTFDADDSGDVSAADVSLHETMAGARMATFVVVALLRADLNGDGAVTEAELRQMLAYERRGQMPRGSRNTAADQMFEREIRATMAADLDGDGRITAAEAISYARSRPEYQKNLRSGLASLAQDVLAFDADGDGRVTDAEVVAAAEALFHATDTDGNGTISLEELTAQKNPSVQRRGAIAPPVPLGPREPWPDQQIRDATPAVRAPNAPVTNACNAPKASAAAKVVLLGAYEAEAVSTSTIGSQDIAIGTASLVVEPGEEPLYVIVASYSPAIWRVSGATSRIERLVLAASSSSGRAFDSEAPMAGATGLAKDRVSFLQRGCLSYFDKAPSPQVVALAGQISGKSPAVTSGQYAVSGFVVPSGEAQIRRGKTQRTTLVIENGQGSSLVIKGTSDTVDVKIHSGRPDLLSNILLYHPGGVVVIDPAEVAAVLPVARYEVLPQEAGLMQLVQNGALELKRGTSDTFLIREKTRYPAGLYGGHSVKFVLLRGVPEPDGDPGHSCVAVEATGEPLKGMERCRQ